VVAGGDALAMAFGTLSAYLFESSRNRSPEPAVLFYATDDEVAGEDVERLIRTAGFEPAKVGGIEQPGRLEVGGDLHDLVVGSRIGAIIDQRGLICGVWMGVTVPEVIGDGHAVGHDRDRIGVVSDNDRGATCQALYRGPLAPGGSPRLTLVPGEASV
jgi:hypothetical protein